jgi:hypothetical protein
MTAIPGVRVTGAIVPTDSTDTYATIDPIYGIDGMRSEADKTTRNAIPTARRRQGMLVCTQDTMELWQLKAAPWAGTDADWILISGSGGGPVIVPLTNAVAVTAASVLTHTVGRAIWTIAIYNAATGVREDWIIDASHNGFVGNDATGIPNYSIYGPGPGGNGHLIDVNLNGAGASQIMRLQITANGTGWAVEILSTTQVAGAA